MTAIIWFRQDLRLDDNPALDAAVSHGGPVIPVYIWAPHEEGNWPPGGASKWWLHQSLGHLVRMLESVGSRLIIRRGDSLPTLRELVKKTLADAVFWNRRYEPAIIRRDTAIKTALADDGLHVESFNSALLFEPWEIHKREGGPFQVFTPFWKACRAHDGPDQPRPAPPRLPAPPHWPRSLDLGELNLEPEVDWAAGFRGIWTPGGDGAQRQLQGFLEHRLRNYRTQRDRLDIDGTSRLAPFLHFGDISIRRVWQTVREFVGTPEFTADVEVFLRELGWREFAHHLLFHFPHTPDEPLRSAFRRFPWRNDAQHLKAWQRGRTGYPVVDAGLRQLWQTGAMHNRVRMVTASFLVKDLLIDWRRGTEWFWDTLVCADLANNTLGWQWSAGCGADAAPYFRVFNPVSQGLRFDPQGDYVRRFVPELARLPPEWIHHPWKAPADVLRQAGVRLGDNYPRRIVEHEMARKEALAALSSLSKE